jgi:hypothetical protein
MMEAANTSETSIHFYQTTRRNISEDSHIHIRRRENLKSHNVYLPYLQIKIKYFQLEYCYTIFMFSFLVIQSWLFLISLAPDE